LLITSLKSERYVDLLCDLFEELGNPEDAQWQIKYMRYQFDFFGLKAPVWLPAATQLFKEEGVFEDEELKSFARLCMEREYRELLQEIR